MQYNVSYCRFKVLALYTDAYTDALIDTLCSAPLHKVVCATNCSRFGTNSAQYCANVLLDKYLLYLMIVSTINSKSDYFYANYQDFCCIFYHNKRISASIC
jgi:hypothetical protein